MRFDHVAIEVDDFDERVAALVDEVGMTLVREGVRHRTGQRIAMLGDETGVKIELIEADRAEPTFAHVAFRAEQADDVDAAEAALVDAGWSMVNPAHDLTAAKARTTLLADAGGLHLQVIAYRPDSPDLGTPAETGDGTTDKDR
jgi:catechol 2,3-dioxygenase-like lactoylglutathione lyase family enzyme